MQIIFTTIRLFFIGYIVRLIFRNTNYGRFVLIISSIYFLFVMITNITTAAFIFDFIASILSLLLYVYVYDRDKLIKPKKLKGMNTQFRTKYADQVFFIVLTIVTWFFSISLYFLVNYDILLMIAILVANILAFFMIFNIKDEKIFLITGKTEKQIYEYLIPKKVFKYSPDDFFSSKDYIIDYVAVMYQHRVKTHIYMLPVDQLQSSLFLNATKIDIPHEFLTDLKKYQFVSITFKEKTPRLKRLK
jgi:hypothetical protein